MTRTLTATLAAALLSTGCTLLVDPEKYAPAECGPNEKPCGYKCVPMDDPATGCGNPGCEACPGVAANQHAACNSEAQCAPECNVGYGACDADQNNGCETQLNVNGFCGACWRYCTAGTCDPAQGLCLPEKTAPVQPGVVSLLGERSTLSYRVFYATPAEIRVIDFGPPVPNDTLLMGSPSGVTALAGGSGQIVFSSEDAAGASLTVFQIYDPLGTSKLLSAKFYVPGAQTLLANALAYMEWAWWVPAGSTELFNVSTFTPGVESASPLVAPATAWRALTVDSNGYAYAADDALSGRILTFAPPGLPSSAVTVTGTGTVGALAVRHVAAGAIEIYWGDLATGDVIRQVGGKRTTIHHGKGPTTRMRMVADDQGVYWADADNAEVMEYLPTLYGSPVVVPLARVAAREIAVCDTSVLWWPDAAGSVAMEKR